MWELCSLKWSISEIKFLCIVFVFVYSECITKGWIKTGFLSSKAIKVIT